MATHTILPMMYANAKLAIPCTTPRVSQANIAIRRSPPPIQVGISSISSCLGVLHISTSIIMGNVI